MHSGMGTQGVPEEAFRAVPKNSLFVSQKYMNPEKDDFDNVHFTLGLADGDLDRKCLKTTVLLPTGLVP